MSDAISLLVCSFVCYFSFLFSPTEFFWHDSPAARLPWNLEVRLPWPSPAQLQDMVEMKSSAEPADCPCSKVFNYETAEFAEGMDEKQAAKMCKWSTVATLRWKSFFEAASYMSSSRGEDITDSVSEDELRLQFKDFLAKLEQVAPGPDVPNTDIFALFLEPKEL